MFKKLGLFVIIALLVLSVSMAQATTNANRDVTRSEPWGAIVYQDTISLNLLTTGDVYYTQMMLIGAVDKSRYGFMYAICTEVGTEDVNIFLEYSADGVTWIAGSTDSDLDAVGTTAVNDTVGIVQGTACDKYQTFPYMRMKVVPGQTITTGSILTFKFVFPKIPELAKTICGSVSDYTP